MYRDQNTPGGVVETETGQIGVEDGNDCGPVTAREGRRGRERRRQGGREGGRDGGIDKGREEGRRDETLYMHQ